jgi:hypothetical protein
MRINPLRTSDDVQAESTWRISTARKEARLLKDALAGAALVIALQWLWIAWLLWFRKGQ